MSDKSTVPLSQVVEGNIEHYTHESKKAIQSLSGNDALQTHDQSKIDSDISSLLLAKGEKSQQSAISRQEIIDACFDGDHALAQLIIKIGREKYCKNVISDKWMKFNGSIWEVDRKNCYIEMVVTLQKKIQKVYNETPPDDSFKATRNQLRKTFTYVQSKKQLFSLANLAACGEDSLGVSEEIFDANKRYIAATNGVIDLQELKLIPSDPSYYITKTLGVPYDENAPEPEMFLRFLDTVFHYPITPPIEPSIPTPPSSLIQKHNTDDIKHFIKNYKNDSSLYTKQELAWIIASQKIIETHESNLLNFENRRSSTSSELIQYIQRIYGYILSGNPTESTMLVFYGPEGRNGKGVLTRISMRILGDYGCEVQPEILLRNGKSTNSGAPNPALLEIQGKRLIVASETNPGQAFDTSLIKRITGNDEIVARGLYSNDQSRFRPSFVLILQTNYPPNAPADDIAFLRRIKFITFNRVFTETPDSKNYLHAPIDKTIEESLVAEGPSILKWIVEGLRMYRQEGSLQTPDTVTEDTKKYIDTCDQLGEFIQDYCIVGAEYSERSTSFTAAFIAWLKVNGYKTVSHKTIVDRMQKKGFKKVKKSNMYFLGLELCLTSKMADLTASHLETFINATT